MWNEKTKQLVADGKLVVIGVIQEQHAERCRLYRQWKEYEFPIVQDAFTGLGLAVVPVPVLIDEFGIVVKNRPRVNTITDWVNQLSVPPENDAPKLDSEHATVKWLSQKFESDQSAETMCALGDANLKLGTDSSSRESIRCYLKSLSMDDLDESLRGALNFRLGVAYRMLFDLTEVKSQDSSDFSTACDYWGKALAESPNQYIWRRRIQQYGPRQIKPYPFYDWVEEAQADIVKRGETPFPLTVPLTGSEIAQPNRVFSVASEVLPNPDSQGKITRDNGVFVEVHSTVVPAVIAPGESVRVHLRFDLNDATWNNESDDLVVWINNSESGTVSQARLEVANVKESSSTEAKTVEFEIKTGDDVGQDMIVNGYVLYYVCESEGDQCLYRRQDFSIPLSIEQR